MANETKFFRLQEGEKIVEAIKPLPNLKWYFFFQGIVGWFIFMLIISGVFLIPLAGLTDSVALPVFIIAFLFLLLIIPYLSARLMYDKRFYWITNKRIIAKRGFIGYRVNSIPLERISDVIISRSFIEMIFGFGSVFIQSLAGQVTVRDRFGAEGNLQAVPDPEGLQQKIFELVKQKRKAEKLAM